MHVRASCLILLCFVVSPVGAQDQEMIEAVEAHVKKLMDAYVEGKPEATVDLTHPNVLKSLGGKEKALQTIKAVMDQQKALGLAIQIKEVGKPTVVKGEKDYFAVVPYTMMASGKGVNVTETTAVVGVSTDGGKAWRFVNVTASGEKGVREILPDLPRELKVPTPERKKEQEK